MIYTATVQNGGEDTHDREREKAYTGKAQA